MEDLNYQPVESLSDARLLEDLQSGDPARIANALYSAVRFCDDSKWTQDHCIAFLTSPHVSVRWAAATCLGDLAFLRKSINAQIALDALIKAQEDQSIADPVSFSISLVNQFAISSH